MLQLMSERECHLVTAVSEFCTANVSLHPQVLYVWALAAGMTHWGIRD